jgi:hypothetical protein
VSDKQYDNSGILFVNDRKEKPEHADRNGSATVDGKEYWVSGWIKQGAKGQFLSLSFKPKEEKKDWIKPELREKFQDMEDRNDDSAKDEVVLDDDFDPTEPVNMDDIPF